MTSIKFSHEFVTPQMAKQWLDTRDEKYRPLRRRHMMTLLRDMVADHWVDTAETIKFDVDGNLIDGQHRLTALVESGLGGVQFRIARSVGASAALVLDTGAKRTAADSLHMLGRSNSALLASAVRIILGYQAGALSGQTRPFYTHSEINDFALQRPDIMPSVVRAYTVKNYLPMRVSALAAGDWILCQVDSQGCSLFMSQVVERVNLPSASPVIALHDRVAEIRRTKREASNADLLSLLFRAWNYWRNDEPVQLLPLFKGGKSIEIPVPR